jgi:hypothetical protein
MLSRFGLILLVAALSASAASKKNVATSRGENEDLKLTVTLYLDPADIKGLIGSDLGGHYFVADVKLEPKYGKQVVVDRDDFLLRTDKDGEKARPFAPSQVAGQGGLVVGQVTDNTGVGSPGWTGASGPVIRGGGIGRGASAGSGGDVDTSRPQVKPQAAEKADPIKQTLETRQLPAGKTGAPVSGLLYFPMEKQKMKDLELTFGGKENRITLRFKPE